MGKQQRKKEETIRNAWQVMGIRTMARGVNIYRQDEGGSGDLGVNDMGINSSNCCWYRAPKESMYSFKYACCNATKSAPDGREKERKGGRERKEREEGGTKLSIQY